jgi:hypothetical protein
MNYHSLIGLILMPLHLTVSLIVHYQVSKGSPQFQKQYMSLAVPPLQHRYLKGNS